MSIFDELRSRLDDVDRICRELADATTTIERGYLAGRRPVPALIVAQVLVGVDTVAADLARLADRLGNGADVLALTREELSNK